MRWIGVDYGESYIGVAVSNDNNTMAIPKEIILFNNHINFFTLMLELDSFQGFVVGLPLHLSGHEGVLAEKARKFGTHLNEQFKLKVIYEDERLTSKQSESIPRKKKARYDDIAASIILQQYLDRK